MDICGLGHTAKNKASFSPDLNCQWDWIFVKKQVIQVNPLFKTNIWYNLHTAGLFWGKMMKISNTILAVFQLKNEMSAKAAHKFMANLD